VHVPEQLDAPIEGRVVDANGVGAGGVQLQIVHLFPEAFDRNSYMILPDEAVRALGGFSSPVVGARDGRFTLRGVSARGGDPFVIRAVDKSLRVTLPQGIAWTSPGGTWVDVAVANAR
jgi:hypothetical protein